MKSDKNTFDIGPVVTKGNKTVSIPYDDGQLYFDIFVRCGIRQFPERVHLQDSAGRIHNKA